MDYNIEKKEWYFKWTDYLNSFVKELSLWQFLLMKYSQFSFILFYNGGIELEKNINYDNLLNPKKLYW